MRRRLPRFDPAAEETLGDVSLDARPSLPGHLIGVVLATPGMSEARYVAPLVEALAERGVDVQIERLFGAEISPAAEARLREIPALLTVGALGVASFRPKIAVVFTGYAPRTSWSPAARALHSAFDLELAEPRAGVFAELASMASFVACPSAH